MNNSWIVIFIIVLLSLVVWFAFLEISIEQLEDRVELLEEKLEALEVGMEADMWNDILIRASSLINQMEESITK